ncbi:hypothetical protein [Bordetella holmesii]|uniref:N-acetyltransferase YedL n=2 Tax=Bordetella holmesii TaxID=35814 RepID=A0ABP3BKB3_9BORD|nr:hypothetical protein [Bordetella holmesii]AHV94020.1 hypothetical protein D560_0512 [Bordetella holmesii ATCC 51541]AIT25192.1 hypothetical protein D558_0503 [Bordetella holmesii 44057]EWM45759.1 hypothetical protein D557_3767 [Bordetella holmesii 70147]EWM48913.1 hypothetical protein D556_0507 [Bordetella holmesii 41130]EWM49886.1 hypothetical protein D555_0514 [Bordetella holmesii 35009]
MFGFFKKQAPEPNPEVQAEFGERVNAAAADFLAALPDASRFDYLPASVALLDSVAAQVRAGEFSLTPMQRVGMAAYLYEVARRSHGGQYEVCDNDDLVVLVTGQPDFDVCLCGISRVERTLSGKEDEPLLAFYRRYEAAVSAAAPATLR